MPQSFRTNPHLSALIRTCSAPLKPHRAAFRTAPLYGVRGAAAVRIMYVNKGFPHRTYSAPVFGE